MEREKMLHERLRDDASMGEQTFSPEELMAFADEIERCYTPRKTVYDVIRDMSYEELGEFIFRVYNKGWFDKAHNVDNEAVFCCTMLDYPESFIDEDWHVYEEDN